MSRHLKLQGNSRGSAGGFLEHPAGGSRTLENQKVFSERGPAPYRPQIGGAEKRSAGIKCTLPRVLRCGIDRSYSQALHRRRYMRPSLGSHHGPAAMRLQSGATLHATAKAMRSATSITSTSDGAGASSTTMLMGYARASTGQEMGAGVSPPISLSSLGVGPPPEVFPKSLPVT
jgi:hypothetical protein